MRLSGERAFGVDPEQVWTALHDVEMLRLCVPGCVAVRQRTPSLFEAEARVALGPVTVPFAGTVEIIESDRPVLLVLKAQGGGLVGRATGTARLTLRKTGEGRCRLAYAIEAERSGPLAVVGSLLLASIARELTDRFVTTFAARIEPPRHDATLTPPASGVLRRASRRE